MCVRFNQCSTRRPSPERPIKRDNAVLYTAETPSPQIQPTGISALCCNDPTALVHPTSLDGTERAGCQNLFGGSKRATHRRLLLDSKPSNALFDLTPQAGGPQQRKRTNAKATPWPSDDVVDVVRIPISRLQISETPPITGFQAALACIRSRSKISPEDCFADGFLDNRYRNDGPIMTFSTLFLSRERGHLGTCSL